MNAKARERARYKKRVITLHWVENVGVLDDVKKNYFSSGQLSTGVAVILMLSCSTVLLDQALRTALVHFKGRSQELVSTNRP